MPKPNLARVAEMMLRSNKSNAFPGQLQIKYHPDFPVLYQKVCHQ